MGNPTTADTPDPRPRPPLAPDQCLLSEFDLPGLRFIVRNDRAGWWLAAACAGWTMLVLLLGDWLGANCMAIVIRAVADLGDGRSVAGSVPNVYGYLSTAHTAPYYLLVGPILLLLSHRFLRLAGRSLLRCEECGVLKHGNRERWHERLSRVNRLWCRWPVLAAFPVILFLCLWFQLRSLSSSNGGLPPVEPGTRSNLWEVGYVQAPNHARWAAGFNALDQKSGIEVLDQRNLIEPLAAALFGEIDKRNLAEDARIAPWLTFSGGKPAGFRLQDCLEAQETTATSLGLRIEAVAIHPERSLANPAWEDALPWAGAFPLVATLPLLGPYFDSIRTTRDLSVEEEVSRAPFLGWYRCFIVLGQIQIAFFFTYMLWILLKVQVYFSELYRLLPDVRKRSAGLARFSPYVYDPVGRFGLGALFAPYNLLILIIAVGSSYFALNLPDSNVYRAITHAEGTGSGITRVAHITAILLVTAGVLIGPMWLYPRKLSSWTESRHLGEIRRKLGRSTDPGSRNDLLEQEHTIQKQTTWPKGDNQFRLTLAVVIAVLLLPVSAATDFLPGGVAPIMRLPQYLRGQCKDFCVWLYDLNTSAGGDSRGGPES